MKPEVRAYVEGGAYWRDIAAVASEAQSWLEERAARGGGQLGIILDLDETLLSNWAFFDGRARGALMTAWSEWVREGTAAAIEPVREIYHTSRRRGLDVIFLTGRTETDRPGTVRNLREIGCAEYALLACRPDRWEGSCGAFKIGVRRQLAAEGWTIVANIGDQESDLAGGFAEKTYKLPNPFYTVD